jgi:phosphate starvation-inducible PhoH-like protein
MIAEKPRGKRVTKYKGAEEESVGKLVPILPRNENQRTYLDALKKSNQVIALGPSGCKTGDTLIAYNRGKRKGVRKITLEDFVKKFNGEPGVRLPFKKQADTFVHSYNQETGEIFLNKVIGAWRTGYKEVLQITTEDCGFVKITKGDKVLLEDGTFKVAKEVVVGDRLLCKGDFKCPKTDRTKKKETKRNRVVVEGLKYYEGGWSKKTHCHKVNKTYIYKRNHKARLILEADLNNVSYEDYIFALKENPDHTYKMLLDADLEIHHKDGVVMNDFLDNLEALTKADHARLHYKDGGQENFGRVYKKISTVVSVEDLGVLEVFDLSMQAPHHNFVVNDGIITHNTGKTWIPVTFACNLYLGRKIDKIILTRPAVSVGKSLGALPGDMNEKYGPWLSPLLNVMEEQMGKGVVETSVKNGNIRMAPLEYMRGSSFNDAFVICDEAQNLTIEELKMLTTRIGENCTFVLSGDIRQSDIKQQSGLSKAIHLAKKYQMDIPVIEFTVDDIVRSDVCKQWIQAFYEENL